MAFDNLATEAYTKWSTALDTTQREELDPDLKDERQRKVVEEAMNTLYDTSKFKQGKKIKELEKEIEDLKQENESLRNLVLEYAQQLVTEEEEEDLNVNNKILFFD